jgi:hypothetical protein
VTALPRTRERRPGGAALLLALLERGFTYGVAEEPTTAPTSRSPTGTAYRRRRSREKKREGGGQARHGAALLLALLERGFEEREECLPRAMRGAQYGGPRGSSRLLVSIVRGGVGVGIRADRAGSVSSGSSTNAGATTGAGARGLASPSAGDGDADLSDLIVDQLFDMSLATEQPPRPASRRVLSALPRRRCTGGADLKGETCAVCLEPYSPGQLHCTLPCKHVFHDECIGSWLCEQHTCPTCRLPLEEETAGERVEEERLARELRLRESAELAAAACAAGCPCSPFEFLNALELDCASLASAQRARMPYWERARIEREERLAADLAERQRQAQRQRAQHLRWRGPHYGFYATHEQILERLIEQIEAAQERSEREQARSH